MIRNALVALFVLTAPSLALAQTAPAKDKAAVTFNEIERGLFFGVQGGWLFMLNPPAANGPRPFSPGQTAMVEVGYEFGERVSVALFAMAAQNRASSTYTGHSDGTYSGDFASLVPGANVRVNAFGFSDSQGVKRTWLYVRGGAGFAMFSPKTLLPNGDIFLTAGPGVEYFTRLRHFSVGLEVTGSFLLTNATAGFAVTPNLRYAF